MNQFTNQKFITQMGMGLQITSNIMHSSSSNSIFSKTIQAHRLQRLYSIPDFTLVLSVGHLQYNLTVQNCLLPGYRWIIWLLHVWYKCAHTILGHNRYGQINPYVTFRTPIYGQVQGLQPVTVSYSTGVWIIAQWVADYRIFRSINRGKNHIWSIV